MRTCRACTEEKPLDAFGKKRDGLATMCRLCMNIRQLWHKYRLTPEQYHTLLTEQGGRCAICKELEPKYTCLSVDHDHETGEVRGLLCSPCNRGLGQFRDNPLHLRAAARYLEGKTK